MRLFVNLVINPSITA